MKTFGKIMLIILAVVSVSFTSCKKDDDSPSDSNTNSVTPTSTYKVTLKIDNGTTVEYTQGTAMLLGDKIIIGANNGNSDIQITTDTDIKKGTYTEGIGISHGENSLAIYTLTNITSYSFVVDSHDTVAKKMSGSYTVSYLDNNDNTVSHTAYCTYDIHYN